MGYTLLKQGAFHNLQIDGEDCICPFRNPVPVPGKFAGQIDYVNLRCSSNCALFHHTVDGNNLPVVHLCCSNRIVNIDQNSNEKLTSKSIFLD